MEVSPDTLREEESYPMVPSSPAALGMHGASGRNGILGARVGEPHHAHPPGPLGPPYRVGAEDLQIGFLRLKQLGHHLEETLHEEVDALAVTGHEQLVQRLHGDAHVSGESSTTAIAQPHAEYSVLITPQVQVRSPPTQCSPSGPGLWL